MTERTDKPESFLMRDPEIARRKAELERLKAIETYKTTSDPVTAGNAEKLRQELMSRHQRYINENEKNNS